MPGTFVEFFDITTHDGWMDEEFVAEHQPILCTAMGKVVHEDDNLLILAPLHAPGKVGYFIIILKGTIVSRRDNA